MKGKVDILIGAQWGDEGKGNVADMIAPDADVFVRYQGGANAGHTVAVDGKKIVFKLLSSGMLYPGKLCVLGNGVVIDPEQFLLEIDELHQAGRDRARLVVSPYAHVVMPYHKILERAQEAFRGKGRGPGAVAKGIGPCYIDKCARIEIRVEDLLDEGRLRDAVSTILEEKNRLLTKLYGEKPLSMDEVYEPAREWGNVLAAYVGDAAGLLYESLENGKYILLEGAHGAMLDIDHGVYPYVLGSPTSAPAAFSGSGLPVTCADRIIAVAKAYTTRSGEGPMPTEDKGEAGEHLRTKGEEFESDTGKARRCGWLDMVALRHVIRLNGCDSIALMKQDVLSGMEEIKVCAAYDLNGTRMERFPGSPHTLAECSPVFETLRGWSEDISGCADFESLPGAAQDYVRYIEERAGAPVKLIGVGPDRNQSIRRGF